MAEEDDSVLVLFSSSPLTRDASVLPPAAAKRVDIDVLDGCFIRLKAMEPAPDGSPQCVHARRRAGRRTMRKKEGGRAGLHA